MRFRKPELIPLLFIICAELVLFGLALWQVERLQWKNALVESIATAQTLPAVTDIKGDVTYRNAALTGHYIPGKILHVVGQKTGGYVWLAPFKLDDSDTVLMVSLGWFASGTKEAALPTGVVNAGGILRPPHAKRFFSPPDNPAKNLWFTEDVAEMSQATGQKLVPYILDNQNKPVLRNDHLSYAITWFAIAIIGLVMFGIYHRKPKNSV